ncbi:amine sulfotransferase-like isoform X2 [Python bivittatus]|nr:amine sulfotransferase-like isoform X2 [Python bivittatus]XP_025031585.1 amine sulfotransferase-like isoform X2 [Python bivittatus]XP_025031586.1 amine sulfotransferase-like isoform X2 [Python bivittatus]
METPDKFLYKYKGFYFVTDLVSPETIDSLDSFEIRDDDVFIITYPKSGTIWTQNILSLIFHERHRDGTENITLINRAPWLEYNVFHEDLQSRPSPRLFSSHLPYYLVPSGLRKRRGKIIYVYRNPKDVLVSGYYFSKIATKAEKLKDFDTLLEKFLAGKGTIGDWKNTLTVAQNERFDSVFKERLEKLPFTFCWEIHEDSEPTSSSVEENNM